jgi:N-acetylmuramoyl-L-alanine amidase
MKIVISSGHGKYIRGASGYPVPPQCDEVDEARRMVDRIYDLLHHAGVDVVKFHDDVSTSQSANLDRIVDFHNAQGSHDLDVSVHFNAYDGNAHGCEVLYVTQETLAGEVCDAIVAAGDFTDRGAKYRGDLAFLNGTNEPAILIETCFCDNTTDCNKYNDKFEEICAAIASSISGEEIGESPPPDRPDRPDRPDQPPSHPTGGNWVDIHGAAQGAVQVLINSTTVYGDYRPGQPVVDMFIDMHGDVTVVLNGEPFHNHPPEEEGIPANQKGIITTVFGGGNDNEYSAYGPYDSEGRGPYLNDSDNYVSLPWTVPNAGINGSARVRVINNVNGKSAVGWVGDKGPWFVDDNYPDIGERPLAEQCYENGEECPRGPNEGTVPNGAGIDISPNMARELGINGKGMVDWKFEDAVA